MASGEEGEREGEKSGVKAKDETASGHKICPRLSFAGSFAARSSLWLFLSHSLFRSCLSSFNVLRAMLDVREKVRERQRLFPPASLSLSLTFSFRASFSSLSSNAFLVYTHCIVFTFAMDEWQEG